MKRIPRIINNDIPRYVEGGDVPTPAVEPRLKPATETNIPKGGYAKEAIGVYGVNPFTASIYGGPLSYGSNNNQQKVNDYHAIKNDRKALRNSLINAGATTEDILNAQSVYDPLSKEAYKKRRDSRSDQLADLQAQSREAQKKDINGKETWSRSEFKPGETARNYARFDDSQGFQAPGVLGLVQNIFDPKAVDTLDSNWQNPATKSIVSVGYGPGEVDPAIAKAAGYTKQVSKTAGNYGILSGTGRDTLGNKGVLGDIGGWVGDRVGLTNYNTKEAQAARTAAEDARIADAKAARLAALAVVKPTVAKATTTPSVYTQPASIGVDTRDRESAAQKAAKAATRAQLEEQAKASRAGVGSTTYTSVGDRKGSQGYTGSTGGSSSSNAAGGGGGTHCCTAALKQGGMSITKVKELRKWHRAQSAVWQDGYDVYGKFIADNLVAGSDFWSDITSHGHSFFVEKKITPKSLLAFLVIAPGSMITGLALKLKSKVKGVFSHA